MRKSLKTVANILAIAVMATATTALASTVNLGTLTPFTGGDAGEGIDLTGNIIYAFNLGGSAQTVQGVNFVAASVSSLPTGVTTTGSLLEFNYTGANPGGANAADYGATADDDALENMTSSVWYGGNWTIDLAVTPGTQYQLQLILQEGFWSFQGGVAGGASAERNFNVSVETASPDTLSLGLANFVTGVETDGADAKQPGADFGQVYTYTFTATDSSFRVSLDDNPGDDANTALNALTLEEVTADTTPPDISTLDPVDDATGVPTYSDLVVTFDEDVAFGTGNITIKETVGDAVVDSFDVTSSPNLSLSGVSVTISPTNNLAGTTGYYVQIDPEAIDDLAGNSFAGITDTTSWSFTTAAADVTDPGVLTLIPANSAIDVSFFDNLSVTFDEDVVFGTGDITLRESGGGLVEAFDVTSSPNLSLSGATVTINPSSDLSVLNGYYVEIAPEAIDDLTGNSFAGISGDTAWSFTTKELVFFDDFNTDPDLSGGWTDYAFYGNNGSTFPEALTDYATWSGSDLGLSSPDSGTTPAVNWAAGISLLSTTRTPTEPVTLTVKSLGKTSGSWGYAGLMISAVPTPGYTATADDTYSLVLIAESATHFHYEVRKAYKDGTSNFQLHIGASTAFSGPYVIDIVRNAAGNYEFLADGNLLYTSGDVAADTYDTAVKDSMIYYQIIFGGEGALTATVDDFGVPAGPPSGTIIFVM